MNLFQTLGTALNPITTVEFEEPLQKAYQNINDLNKSNSMKNLQQLKGNITEEFDVILANATSVYDYCIDKGYKKLFDENKDQVNGGMISDIATEIREDKGHLVYITQDERLAVSYELVAKLGFIGSNKITDTNISMYLNTIEEDKSILDTVSIDIPWRKDMLNNSLKDLYIIKDTTELVKFYEQEQADILKKEQEEKKAKLAAKNELRKKATEYGLNRIDETLIKKLDKIKESKLFGDANPKEVLDLMEEVGGIPRSEVQDMIENEMEYHTNNYYH
jgi:hypothetical protein